MKIAIDKQKFVGALEIAQKAVSKTNMQILECFLLEASGHELRITGNNYEMSIQTSVETDVIESGRTTVNAKMLLDVVKSMPNEEIVITVGDKKMCLEAGKTKMEISVMDASGYPAIPKAEESKSFEMDVQQFKDAVNRVNFVAHSNQQTPIYEGIHFNVQDNILDIVALDGATLAVRSINVGAQNLDVIIKAEGHLNNAIKVLSDEGKVKISTNGKIAFLENGNVKIHLRLLEGTFFDHKMLICQKSESSVKATTKVLKAAIERATLLFNVNEKGKSEALAINIISTGMLQLSLTSIAGSMNEEMLAEVDTVKNLEFHYNPRLLNECIKSIEDEEVLLRFGDRGVCFMVPAKEDDRKFIYIVMPVRG